MMVMMRMWDIWVDNERMRDIMRDRNRSIDGDRVGFVDREGNLEEYRTLNIVSSNKVDRKFHKYSALLLPSFKQTHRNDNHINASSTTRSDWRKGNAVIVTCAFYARLSSKKSFWRGNVFEVFNCWNTPESY